VTMSGRTAGVVVLTLCLACNLVALNYVFAESKKKEICSDAVLECGGQGGRIVPPGPMSMCRSEQSGKDCDYCDGTTKYRLCASGSQPKKCTYPEKLPKCGDPKKGKCTKASVLSLTYYYCKDNGGGAGTNDCTVDNNCTGVEDS